MLSIWVSGVCDVEHSPEVHAKGWKGVGGETSLRGNGRLRRAIRGASDPRQEFHSGWFAIGEIATSPARTAWHEVSFCCKNKNKNKNTTYALVLGLDGACYCGGASIAVEGGCAYVQEQQATYGYLRNTGSEGYSLGGWVWDYSA